MEAIRFLDSFEAADCRSQGYWGAHAVERSYSGGCSGHRTRRNPFEHACPAPSPEPCYGCFSNEKRQVEDDGSLMKHCTTASCHICRR